MSLLLIVLSIVAYFRGWRGYAFIPALATYVFVIVFAMAIGQTEKEIAWMAYSAGASHVVWLGPTIYVAIMAIIGR